MAGFFQWGRVLQVDLTLTGGQTLRLVDFDSTRPRDAQGLACIVEYTAHTGPEAHHLVVTVMNLAPALQTQLYNTWALARNQSFATKQATRAGRLVVRAGRNTATMRKVCDHLITKVAQPPRAVGVADVATVIEAVDGRLLWENLFADAQTPVDGVSIVGQPPTTASNIIPLPTYSGNGANVSIDTQMVLEALGYQPVMQGDTTVWIPIGGTAAWPTIKLDTIVIPPVDPEGSDGKRGVSCLYDSMFTPGAPCSLERRDYSMDLISATLTTHDPQGWTARLGLRSTLPSV